MQERARESERESKREWVREQERVRERARKSEWESKRERAGERESERVRKGRVQTNVIGHRRRGAVGGAWSRFLAFARSSLFFPKKEKILEHNFYPIMSQPSLFRHLIMESLDSAASLPRSSSCFRLLRLSVFSFQAGWRDRQVRLLVSIRFGSCFNPV